MAKFLTTVAWDETPHLDEAAKRGLLTSYLPHERLARTKGTPSLGSGAIYPIPEEEFVCEPFEFPAHYKHVGSMDVGWNRTAALWGALDPETDVLYLYSEHYRGQAEPEVHAAGIKSRGDWIPFVIDPASRGRSQKDGEALYDQYVALGLKLTRANNAVETGILRVWSRLSTGRLKVFRTLWNFLEEYRIYRRGETGVIVKEKDHLMDSVRYRVLCGVELAVYRPVELWLGRPGLALPKMRGGLESEYDPYAAARNIVNGGAPKLPGDGWWPGKI